MLTERYTRLLTKKSSLTWDAKRTELFERRSNIGRRQKLTDLFKEGDDIQAKVIKTDDGDGVILLSKKKLEANEHWNEINEAYENGQHIKVKVVRAVNGGVIAAYKEVSGFIPMSQLSDKYVKMPTSS